MVKIDTKKAFSAGLGPTGRIGAWAVAFAAVVRTRTSPVYGLVIRIRNLTFALFISVVCVYSGGLLFLRKPQQLSGILQERARGVEPQGKSGQG
jgi:hypothetical protein